LEKHKLLGRSLEFCHPKRQRVMYLACVCFVFSYIAFDVLDLDGSNFPTLVGVIERSAIVAVLPSEVEISSSHDPIEHSQTVKILFADRLREYVRFQMTRVLESLPRALARAHGYRIGLARDSLPD
jgi:hypothetical protein